jgi:hypothetical protein
MREDQGAIGRKEGMHSVTSRQSSGISLSRQSQSAGFSRLMTAD